VADLKLPSTLQHTYDNLDHELKKNLKSIIDQLPNDHKKNDLSGMINALKFIYNKYISQDNVGGLTSEQKILLFVVYTAIGESIKHDSRLIGFFGNNKKNPYAMMLKKLNTQISELADPDSGVNNEKYLVQKDFSLWLAEQPSKISLPILDATYENQDSSKLEAILPNFDSFLTHRKNEEFGEEDVSDVFITVTYPKHLARAFVLINLFPDSYGKQGIEYFTQQYYAYLEYIFNQDSTTEKKYATAAYQELVTTSQELLSQYHDWQSENLTTNADSAEFRMQPLSFSPQTSADQFTINHFTKTILPRIIDKYKLSAQPQREHLFCCLTKDGIVGRNELIQILKKYCCPCDIIKLILEDKAIWYLANTDVDNEFLAHIHGFLSDVDPDRNVVRNIVALFIPPTTNSGNATEASSRLREGLENALKSDNFEQKKNNMRNFLEELLRSSGEYTIHDRRAIWDALLQLFGRTDKYQSIRFVHSLKIFFTNLATHIVNDQRVDEDSLVKKSFIPSPERLSSDITKAKLTHSELTSTITNSLRTHVLEMLQAKIKQCDELRTIINKHNFHEQVFTGMREVYARLQELHIHYNNLCIPYNLLCVRLEDLTNSDMSEYDKMLQLKSLLGTFVQEAEADDKTHVDPKILVALNGWYKHAMHHKDFLPLSAHQIVEQSLNQDLPLQDFAKELNDQVKKAAVHPQLPSCSDIDEMPMAMLEDIKSQTLAITDTARELCTSVGIAMPTLMHARDALELCQNAYTVLSGLKNQMHEQFGEFVTDFRLEVIASLEKDSRGTKSFSSRIISSVLSTKTFLTTHQELRAQIQACRSIPKAVQNSFTFSGSDDSVSRFDNALLMAVFCESHIKQHKDYSIECCKENENPCNKSVAELFQDFDGDAHMEDDKLGLYTIRLIKQIKEILSPKLDQTGKYVERGTEQNKRLWLLSRKLYNMIILITEVMKILSTVEKKTIDMEYLNRRVKKLPQNPTKLAETGRTEFLLLMAALHEFKTMLVAHSHAPTKQIRSLFSLIPASNVMPTSAKVSPIAVVKTHSGRVIDNNEIPEVMLSDPEALRTSSFLLEISVAQEKAQKGVAHKRRLQQEHITVIRPRIAKRISGQTPVHDTIINSDETSPRSSAGDESECSDNNLTRNDSAEGLLKQVTPVSPAGTPA
jgi:hypothetical protein